MRKIAVIDAEDTAIANQIAICQAREDFRNYKALCEHHPDAVIIDIHVAWCVRRFHLKGKDSFMAIMDRQMQLISLEHVSMN